MVTIKWQRFEPAEFDSIEDATKETKDVPWFIVHADGDYEEVPIYG